MKIRFAHIEGDDLIKVRTDPRDGTYPTVFWVRLPTAPGMAALQAGVDLCCEAQLETDEQVTEGATVDGDVVLHGDIRASEV